MAHGRASCKWFCFLCGERGRNRTFNLLIKSQLLCQLSYAPALEDYCDYSIPRRFVTRFAQVLRGAPPPLVARCPSVSEASCRRPRPGRRGTWSGRTDRPFQWSARRSRSALLRARYRSEEHTSELQSPCNLV